MILKAASSSPCIPCSCRRFLRRARPSAVVFPPVDSYVTLRFSFGYNEKENVSPWQLRIPGKDADCLTIQHVVLLSVERGVNVAS